MVLPYIYKIDKKIEYCIEALFEAGQIIQPQKSDFYQHLGRAATTWASAFQAHRLSSELQGILTEKCRFPPHPHWIDPNKSDEERRLGGQDYNGRDTPALFRKMLRGIWGLPQDLGLSLMHEAFSAADPLFASFALVNTGQQTNDGGAMLAFLEIDIDLFRHQDDETGELLTYGFSKVVLEVVLQPDTKFAYQHGATSEDLSGAILTRRGTSHSPRWELTVPEGLLNGSFYTTAPLFEVVEAEAGTCFNAYLRASVNDGSLFRGDGKPPFGIEKQRLLELLLSRGFGISQKGVMTLGIQELTIVTVG